MFIKLFGPKAGWEDKRKYGAQEGKKLVLVGFLLNKSQETSIQVTQSEFHRGPARWLRG